MAGSREERGRSLSEEARRPAPAPGGSREHRLAAGDLHRSLPQGVGLQPVVGGEDRRQPAGVAGVDDQVEDLPDPGRGLLGAQLIEDEQLGLGQGIEDLPLRLGRVRIEGGLDLVDQRRELDEAAADPVALDQLAQDRHGQMGLAGSRRADEEEAGLAEAARLLDEPVHILLGRLAGAPRAEGPGADVALETWKFDSRQWR